MFESINNDKSALCVFAAAIFSLSAAANADVVRISESDFPAGSGLITFSEFPLGTTNPTYTATDYGGGPNTPTVSFGGFFDGQDLSASRAMACPGGAATGCVVGKPRGLLVLDSGSPPTFITTDSAQPTSPVLSGSPKFNGPIAIIFDEEVAAVGLDGGFFDGSHSTRIEAFASDGSSLGSVTNASTGIEFLGLVTDSGSEQIRGLLSAWWVMNRLASP